MMARSTKEWIGKTDDSAVPPRVRLRVLERFGFRCDIAAHGCGRPISAGEKWCCDHVQALINGGANRESNLHPLCEACTPEKDKKDVRQKSRTYKRRASHYGIKRRGRSSFQTNRNGPFKKKMDGTVEKRR